MCIHCCRLRKTPCPTIPYSCPHCPVNTISSSCRLSDPRSFGENPFPIGRISNPPSDPCHSLPPRWLEVNRRVIYALAKRMGRSPEAAHYAVLLLLYANYGKVLRIAQKRRSFPVPRCGFPEQDFFCTGGSLFNDSGFLTDPMAPDTLAKLLRMLQDYISRLRELNKKFKWYANGEDRDEILCLLGEQDELVRLLRAIFGNKDVVPIPQLLRALCDLDFNYLTSGKLTSKKSPWRVKHISDLYSEVVDPYKSKKCSSGDSRAFPNRIQEVTIQTVISPKKPQCPCGARTVQVRVRSQRDNKQQLPSKPSFAYLKAEPFDSSKKSTDAPKAKHRHHRKKQMVRKSSKGGGKIQQLTQEPLFSKLYPSIPVLEMPKLLYEPYDSRKSSTWRTRYSNSERMLPDGRISKRRVERYMHPNKQRELSELQKKQSTQNEKEYEDMFGTDLRRRSMRKSDKRKSSTSRKPGDGYAN